MPGLHSGIGISLDTISRGANSWVTPNASIDLDFANSRAFGTTIGSLSVTNNGNGTAVDASGVWHTFAANTPRITNLGITIEEARTNSIRNNTMTGAAAGTPGTLPFFWSTSGASGLTTSIVGVGKQNNVDYIDLRIFGTSTGTFFVLFFDNTGATASVGQVWTESFFIALTAGSLSGVTVNIDNRYSAGENAFAISPTSVLTSFSHTSTAPAATTVTLPSLSLSYSNGAVLDLTLRIGWPQLELGAFATTPILTSSAVVARTADVVSLSGITGLSGGISLLAKGTPEAVSTYTSNQIIAQLDDGTTTNRVTLIRVATTAALAAQNVVSAGSNATVTAIGTWAQSVAGKLIEFATATLAQANFNNAGLSSQPLTALPPITTLRIGSNQAGSVLWNGVISRVTISNQSLLNS